MSMSEQVLENKYQSEFDGKNQTVVIDNLNLLNYQKKVETNYSANVQLPYLKKLFESIKVDFSKSSFSINYALIINTTVIISILIFLWLLYIIGFRDFFITTAVIFIVLIMMVFETLSLIEKEISKKGQNKLEKKK
jgi:hypothetical protein